MANFFDQFDAGPAASAPPPSAPGGSSLTIAPDQSADTSSGNFFDQFDGPPDNGRPSALTRVGAGVNSGLISQSLGAPVDLATGAMNLVPRTINTLGQAAGYDPGIPLIEHPVGGSEWFDTQLGKAGIGTKGIAPPEDAAERIEQAAGQGIGGMLAPNMLAKGRALSGILGVAPAVEEALAAGSVKGNAVLGGISGASSQSAAEVVPPQYAPWASAAASMIPGGALALGAAVPPKYMPLASTAGLMTPAGIASLGMEGVSALGRGASSIYRNLPMFTAAGREPMAAAGAANRMRAAASSPTTAFETAANAQPELVPGSLPTTAELSGDPGLLGAQRFRENNSPDFGRETLERRAGNATAQMAHLEGQAPPLASVEDTQAALRQHLADIDATGDQAAQAASTNAQTALVGGAPAGQMPVSQRLDRPWLTQNFTDATTGAVDSAAANNAILSRVQNALDNGNSVVLHADEGRKAVPIVAVSGGVMRDAEGLPWGAMGIGFSHNDHIQIGAAAPSLGKSVPGALPRMTPEETGAAARTAVEAERAPQGAALAAGEAGAQSRLSFASDQFGGQAALGSPEEQAAAPAQYGAAMREPVAAAYAAEQQRLRNVRDSIDPTGTMGMRPDAMKAAVGKIGEMFPAEGGAQLSDAERGLYDTVSNWGDLIPVERAFQMRANINGRIRGLQGSDPQEALRLGVLKNGVDDALAQAVAHVDVGERAGLIHEGLPGVNERFAGTLENYPGMGPSFAQDVARAYANNPTTLRAAGRETIGRGILEAANPGDDALRAGTSSRVAGNGNGQARRSGRGAGDQGVPQTSVGPEGQSQAGSPSQVRAGLVRPPMGGVSGANVRLTPLTPEAKQTFADWNAGYRQMGQTFRGETPGTLHAVGKILQKGKGAYDSYNLTDEQVPWIVADRGANGKQGAERFLAAAPPEAHAALDDALAFSLRRTAQNPDGTLNLPKYEKWRINHQGVMSTRTELSQKFGSFAQAQKQLNDIQQSLAEHAASHPLKPGWGDAGLLNRYFKKGAEGAEKMKEYGRITNWRPEAVDAAVDHASFSFAQAAVRDGAVNPKLADTWLRDHDLALSEIPGGKARFENATEAQRSVERAVEAHQTARDDFTKSVAGAFIGDDPGKAIARVFQGANREQKAKLLTDLVRSDKAAAEGLQRAAIGYIRSLFEGAGVPGAEVGAIGPKRFGDFVRENRGVLTQLFPGKIANFDALAADLKRGAQVQGAKINKAGSDTAELTAGRGEHGDHGGIGNAAAVLLAEHAGQHVAHHLGSHLLGALAAPAALVGKMLFSRAKNSLTQRTDQLFDRALLDPQFAADLNRANPATRHETPESIGARLRGRLVQQSLLSARGAGLQ